MCTVHYNCAPVTSATPHAWVQNSLVVRILMFLSSHDIVNSFSNEAQRLVYQRLRRRTKQRLRGTRSVADYSLVHSSSLTAPSFLHSSHNCQFSHILVPLTNFTYCTYFGHNDDDWLTMMSFYLLPLSWCQPHLTVQILVVSTTVLTTTTMHHTALGTTVPNAPHFLCPAKVSTHICLPLMYYITIDQ